MNKSDWKLIIITFLIAIILYSLTLVMNNKNAKEAFVYYEDKLLLRIDLSINKRYKVEGYNGEVIIETNNNKIRVKKENSPLHICSYKGFTSSAYKPIICLPNKIVIKISDKKSELDAVVR
jgi:hypothetical protein